MTRWQSIMLYTIFSIEVGRVTTGVSLSILQTYLTWISQ